MKKPLSNDKKYWSDDKFLKMIYAGDLEEYIYHLESVNTNLVEALEGVLRLTDLIRYPEDTKLEHVDEAITIETMINSIKEALKEAKFEETPKTDNLAGE